MGFLLRFKILAVIVDLPFPSLHITEPTRSRRSSFPELPDKYGTDQLDLRDQVAIIAPEIDSISQSISDFIAESQGWRLDPDLQQVIDRIKQPGQFITVPIPPNSLGRDTSVKSPSR